jgi:phosphoribosylaminoimidazole carboxylase
LQINSALLAARISGASDEVIREKLEQYGVIWTRRQWRKLEQLEEAGFEAY